MADLTNNEHWSNKWNLYEDKIINTVTVVLPTFLYSLETSQEVIYP